MNPDAPVIGYHTPHRRYGLDELTAWARHLGDHGSARKTAGWSQIAELCPGRRLSPAEATFPA